MSPTERQDHDETSRWLAAYAANRCDKAFANLFRVYGGMVYASALRRTSDPQLAEDVTQETFAMLASKAGSLKNHPSIAGWLFATARWIAHDIMKLEKRKREKLTRLQEATAPEAAPGPDVIDDSLPALDEALDKLNASDRDMLLWHYFERIPYGEIAARVGKSEAACRKQASRALDKVSSLLRKQGFAVPAVALVGVLSAQLCKAAPAALAASVLSSSQVAAASLSTSKLILNSVQTMAYTKTKTAIVVAALAAVPLGFQWNQIQSLKDQLVQQELVPIATEQAPRSTTGTSGAKRQSTPAGEDPVKAARSKPVREIIDASAPGTFESLNRQITDLSPEEMTDLLVQLRSTRNHPQYKLLENILFFQLMQRGPEALLNLKLKHPDLPVLGRTYRIWGQTDADAALEHLRNLENDTWYEMGVGAILQGLGDVSPGRALDALTGLDDGKDYHYQNLFRSWSTVEPADAAASLDKVPEKFRSTAISTVADNWPELDPTAARAWVASLPAAEAKIAGKQVEERIAQLENRLKKFSW